MPAWTDVDLDYRPYGRGSEPFVRSRNGFAAASLGKAALAADSARQAHFEAEVSRLSAALDADAVPVFVRFRGERRRMDKGCIGHAVARGFLERPVDGPVGVVTHVVRRRSGSST